MEKNIDFLIDSFKNIDIQLSEKQVEQFIKYYEMLIEKNKVMNLTAITEYNDVVLKHFLDSILVSKVYDMNSVDKFIDVGTGAGFPGIPLKIVFPNIKVTLLDSLNKRVKFLEDVVSELNLENVICIHGRAEEIAHNNDYREKYDMCVSRAVANLSTLSEYCLPFITPGGKFISYKAANIDDELSAAKKAVNILAGKIDNTIKLSLSKIDNIDRNFIIISKIGKTQNKYPRKAGTPSKEPLQ